MKNRAQLLVFAAAASIWLTACSQEGSLSSILPAQDTPDELSVIENTLSFDDTLSSVIDLEGSAQNSITVRNQTDTLIDKRALSPEALKILVDNLRRAEPVAIARPLKAVERSCTVEWQHGDVLIIITCGTANREKYTSIAIGEQHFMADYTLYTSWIESFASAK